MVRERPAHPDGDIIAFDAERMQCPPRAQGTGEDVKLDRAVVGMPKECGQAGAARLDAGGALVKQRL